MRMSVRFLVSAFILTATACGSSTGTNYGGGSTPPASCPSGVSATINATALFTFDQSTATITAGQKGCLLDNTGITHTVSSGPAQMTPSDDRRVPRGSLPHGSLLGATL